MIGTGAFHAVVGRAIEACDPVRIEDDIAYGNPHPSGRWMYPWHNSPEANVLRGWRDWASHAHEMVG